MCRIGEPGGLMKYTCLKSVPVFQGNGTNIVRIVPYTAVQFAAYEEFKKVSKKCKLIITNSRIEQVIRFFDLVLVACLCLTAGEYWLSLVGFVWTSL